MTDVAANANIDAQPLFITIERNFRHPVETVFKAWTETDALRQWMGPTDHGCPHAEMDARTGGRYALPIIGPDGNTHTARDFRGDPAAALLEVLDPEQNDSFADHYLDVDYDLSKVMFIATANVIHTVPPALKDRMEVIELSGYTPNEKLEIAKGFLVPKQLDNHGLAKKDVEIGDDAVRALIDHYTREAGVRNLEREIGAICRKVARQLVENGDDADVVVKDLDRVKELLGKTRYRRREKRAESTVGVCTGLAWTEVGGEILETQIGLMRGKGKLTLTGKLGDVMQESARAAVSYVRSRADLLGIDPEFNEKLDVHLHVPEGAIPKDGPSAGITMATSLVSALTDIPVRKDIAMTGEITLRGTVLPVGGIKDKLLAAFRAEITEVAIPHENEKDLEDIPGEIREAMTIHLVESMDEVLTLALDGEIKPLPEGGEGKLASDGSSVDSGSLAH